MKLETTSDSDCDGCGGEGWISPKNVSWLQLLLHPWMGVTERCGRCRGTGVEPTLRLGGHRKKIAVTVNATIIQPDDAVDQLSDAKKFPAWRTMKVPMLQSFSNAHETLWLGRYAEIRTTFSHEDENDKDRAEREANEFYLANREEMDAGAEATRRCVFVSQPDGEGPYYLGKVEDQADLYRAMREICPNELCDFLEGSAGDSAELHFEIRHLTDAEIADLPEC